MTPQDDATFVALTLDDLRRGLSPAQIAALSRDLDIRPLIRALRNVAHLEPVATLDEQRDEGKAA